MDAVHNGADGKKWNADAALHFVAFGYLFLASLPSGVASAQLCAAFALHYFPSQRQVSEAANAIPVVANRCLCSPHRVRMIARSVRDAKQ